MDLSNIEDEIELFSSKVTANLMRRRVAEESGMPKSIVLEYTTAAAESSSIFLVLLKIQERSSRFVP